MQVNVDIVNFGETSSNTSKVAPRSLFFSLRVVHVSFLSSQPDPILQLEQFIETVNNNGNSHLITVPPGTMLRLSDIVMESPICMYALLLRHSISLPFLPVLSALLNFTPCPFSFLSRSGFGAAVGSGGGHAPASTISNQFDSDMQRAIQVTVCLLALSMHCRLAVSFFPWDCFPI
jgi:hypothetical protein